MKKYLRKTMKKNRIGYTKNGIYRVLFENGAEAFESSKFVEDECLLFYNYLSKEN